MNDGHPRSLEDRDVLIVRGDERRHVRLRAWLDGHDGPWPVYRLELFLGGDRFTATGPDLFEALVRLRRQLEPDGWRIAVQGARLDTYPSGMARDMGGGKSVYVMRPGQHQVAAADLVKTLSDAPVEQLATVPEQEAYVNNWRTRPTNG
jgi:hypothetical protein